MTRSVLISGGVLLIALATAWVRFTAEPEPDLADKVVLLQGDEEDIESITWRTDTDTAIIEQRSDDHGAYLWVDYTRRTLIEPEPEPEPAGEEEGEGGEEPTSEPEPAPEPEYEETVLSFKAGVKGDELLSNLSPMLAMRRLEDVSAEKLETIGLTEPEGEMVVVRKGRTATLEIGGEAFGTRDIYMRDREDGAIYLVDDQILRPLKYARTRLPDRTLFGYAQDELTGATLTGPDGSTLEVVQENPDDKAAARWVRAGAADGDEDRQLNTWMEKALGLKASAYADPDTPTEGLETLFTLTLTPKSGQPQTLEVLRAPQGGGELWGRSEHTRGLVKMLKGPTSALSDDVGDVIAGTGEAPEDGGAEEGASAPE